MIGFFNKQGAGDEKEIICVGGAGIHI